MEKQTKMRTLISSGVQITVRTKFRADLSEINAGQFFFNYEVCMENTNDFDVQLISRDWYIFDSLNESRLVSGPGVIGEQPTLKSNEKFTYSSGCDLTSEIGRMTGFYTFKNLETFELFQVHIPELILEYPSKLN